MTNSSISCESSNLRRELKKIPKSSLLIRFGLQRLISRFDVIFFFFRLVPWCLVTQVRDFGDNHLSPPFSHPHLDTVFCSRLLCPRPRAVWAGVRAVTRLSTEGIPHPHTGIPLRRAEVISRLQTYTHLILPSAMFSPFRFLFPRLFSQHSAKLHMSCLTCRCAINLLCP